MQIDFHFYAIYALCMLSGIKPECSRIIAYASQHTDDAKYNHELVFESGGRFKQQMSAHRFLDLNAFSKEVGYEIFLPFHFLPGIEGKDFYEQLCCRQNSRTALEMMKDTLNTLEKPYGLHRLGIALHVYADTWSHQNFHGLLKYHNEVEDLKCENRKQGIFEEFGTSVISELVPPIGHAQAYTCPDEPYLVWSYRPYQAKSPIKINNLDRTMDAAARVYDFLATEVREKKPEIFIDASKDWRSLENKFRNVFAVVGRLEEREKLWQRKLKEGFFGFSSIIRYDDGEWFREAVEVIDKAYMKYDKKDGFAHADWKYFHDALTLHKFYVKNELLPKYGIIT